MPTDADQTPAHDCPSASTLEAFALAADSGDVAVASHVASCERCRSIVEEVRENQRFLGEFTRELRPGEDLFEDPFASREEVPGYTLHRELHRGAQGVVYLATQERTRRDVAVKMLLQGAFATSRQRARFEREAEIASQLRHPNIVTVHDSMPVKGGRFALVMEYIEGRTLDQWSESLATLAPRNRIAAVVELFLQVIDAVHYAHQRGVIHRDLKPANILVDADGRPRIVDFGIAKLHDAAQADRAVAPRARAATAVTREGEFAGTLAYAAPEQLGGRPDAIDTRTDVYALGVIFHELLTGRMPYDVTGSFAEVIDHVVNEPPAPLRQALPEADEDLAVIIEHCLAKEPERRYQSAGALLADLRHRLAGEAINARRSSRVYVVRRWAARHKAVVVGAVAALALVVVGVSSGSYALFERRQRQQVEEEQFRTSQLKAAAELSGENERRQRQAAEAAKNFMARMLGAITPGAARGREVSRTYMLDQAEIELAQGRLADQPMVEREVRVLLGRAYSELGSFAKAAGHLRRAAEINRTSFDKDLLGNALVNELLGRALGLTGPSQLAEALSLLQASLDTRRRLAGEGSAEVASSLNSLGLVLVHNARFDDALGPLREALAIRRGMLAPDSVDLLESITTLAQATWQSSRADWSQASELFEECMSRRAAMKEPDHPVVADSLYQYAHMLTASGDRERALAVATDALAARRRVFGDRSAAAAQCLDLIAGLYAVEGRFREAEPLLVEAATIHAQASGEGNVPRLSTLANLGRVYYKMGRFDKAEPVLLEWHAGLVKLPNADRAQIEHARDCLRQMYDDWDKPAQAAQWSGSNP
ncbi:MAG: protein kinase domain-containing protein [Phycisphaerales bacterium]